MTSHSEPFNRNKLAILLGISFVIFLGIFTNYTQLQSQLRLIAERQTQGEVVDRVEVFNVNYEFVPDNFMETYKMDSVEKADYFDQIMLEEQLRRQSEERKKHRNSEGLQKSNSVPSASHPNQKLPSCLRARNNTVAKSSYGKLPKPYINLSFPKMGTSTLHSFFECGGYQSTHFRCSRSSSCAKCTSQSVLNGFPPLKECIDERPSDVFAQLDNGTYFPQLELLDEFVKGYPDATFFLTFRDIE